MLQVLARHEIFFAATHLQKRRAHLMRLFFDALFLQNAVLVAVFDLFELPDPDQADHCQQGKDDRKSNCDLNADCYFHFHFHFLG